MIRFLHSLKLFLIILFSILLLSLTESSLYPAPAAMLALTYMAGIRLL
jgi:hypothetical protein